jgi:hypothetical protein
MKREGRLKSAFTDELKRQAPHFLSLQFSTAGAPDRCIIGNGITTFWEFKHGTPHYESQGLQELLCIRLAEQSFCRYVLWLEDAKGGNLSTNIVHPVLNSIEASWTGHDAAPLVRHVLRIHQEKG